MNKLTENQFAFICPMQWDAMASSTNGRFCDKCRKEVFDLSNCSIDEVIALQRKHGSICGSIRVATVAVSLATAACQTSTADPTTVESLRSGDKGITRNVISGAPMPPDQLEKSKQP